MDTTALMKNKVFISCVFLGLFEPDFISWMGLNSNGIWEAVHYMFRILLYFAIFAIAFLILFNSIRLSWMTVSIVVFWLVYLVADIVNDVDFGGDCRLAIKTILLVLMIELYCKKDLLMELLNTLVFWLGLYIFINFLTVVCAPDGLYIDDRGWGSNYFLGYKNRQAYIIIPYMIAHALLDYIQKKKLSKTYIAMVVIILITMLLNGSSTGLACCTAFAILILIFGNRHVPGWINGGTGFFVSASLSFAFIGFQFQNNFSFIIETLFGKNETFTQRTTIWAAALKEIQGSPIIGNGNTEVMGINWSWDVTQCHNRFLDVLFVGGVLLLLVFIWMLALASVKLIKCDSNIKNVINFGLIAYAIFFLMEGRRTDMFFYVVLTLAYHVDYFKIQYNTDDGIKKKKINIKIK